jgi:hypothetical protein
MAANIRFAAAMQCFQIAGAENDVGRAVLTMRAGHRMRDPAQEAGRSGSRERPAFGKTGGSPP